MCATVRPLGPGPGAYLLPQLIGFKDHDARKQRLPQYSFGVRKDLKDSSLGPGPGAYKLDSITRNGVDKAPAYSLGKRFVMKARDAGPGPGAHDNHLAKIFQGNRPLAYSMGQRTFLKSKEVRPSPNAYFGELNAIRPKSPAYSMGRRTRLKSKFASPGPAAYGATQTCVTLMRPPKYSMTKNGPVITSKLVTPAPDNYNLQEYKPGHKGPNFSFGVKHSPYAPPMIVECDNY